jgi:hypothetical protein
MKADAPSAVKRREEERGAPTQDYWDIRKAALYLAGSTFCKFENWNRARHSRPLRIFGGTFTGPLF